MVQNDIMPRRRRRKEDLVDLLFTLGIVNGWLVFGLFVCGFGLSAWWWWQYTPEASVKVALATFMRYARWLAILPPLFAALFTWILIRRGIDRACE